MTNHDVIGLIIGCLSGFLGIILSICIKKYNMTSLLTVFDPHKHDEKKASQIAGNQLFLIGVIIIYFEIIHFIVRASSDLLTYAEALSVLTLVAHMIYKVNKYALKDH